MAVKASPAFVNHLDLTDNIFNMPHLAWFVCLRVEHTVTQSQSCLLSDLLQVTPHRFCPGEKHGI